MEKFLTFKDAALSGHTELVLYELPEVVDHVATHLAFSEVVEHPARIILSDEIGHTGGFVNLFL